MHVVVIGGGIAGLSTSLGLARAGARVTLLERGEAPFSGASGLNAAIYRPLEDDAVMTLFAHRTAKLLDEVLGHRTAWLDARGLVLAGAAKAVRRLAVEAARVDLVAQRWPTVAERVPVLEGGSAEAGLWLAAGGVMDLHRIARALEGACRKLGVEVRLGAEVTGLSSFRGARWALTMKGARELLTDAVVLAAGAHSGRLAALAGSRVGVTSYRRTLALLEPASRVHVRQVVWDVSKQVYLRAESGGVLASPCDEVAVEPEAAPVVDQASLALLAEKLSAVTPSLASASVRRAWAGLRTFSADRLPIIGADPTVPGLYWCTGFGGAGMTTGLALGVSAAKAVLGGRIPKNLSAARLGEPRRSLVRSTPLVRAALAAPAIDA